jgi:hypothetical protein
MEKFGNDIPNVVTVSQGEHTDQHVGKHNGAATSISDTTHAVGPTFATERYTSQRVRCKTANEIAMVGLAILPFVNEVPAKHGAK